MKNIHKEIKLFLYFIFLLNLVNSQYENITLKQENITIDFLSESKKFRIIPETQPLFLQIICEGKFPPNTLNKNNYIISYYGIYSDFEERKQLSKSYQGKAVMWLNKQEIKEEFFISVECEISPCNYSLSFFPKKVMDLSLNEKYTYYVTEENKQSIFNLNIVLPEELNLKESNIVQIWAKGGKDLSTSLQGKIYERLEKHNGYIINIDEIKNFQLTFNVEATIGDLVTIGAILFENGISYIYENVTLEELIELDTLLKKEIVEKTCYKMPTTEYKKYYHLNYLLERDIDLYIHSINDDIICNELHPYYKEDFYSIQYTIKDGKYINIYNPIILGSQYNAYIHEGESIAVIPMQPEYDFSYLNYYMFTIGLRKDVFIYECDTYPFCNYDRTNLEKITQIDNNYGSYSYSYKKDELNVYIDPINKKQKMLVFSCLIGVESRGNHYCLLLINIYTDKTKIQLGQIFNQYRFIREFNEDNYIIDKRVFKSSKEEYGYLNIETLTGNISVVIYDETIDIFEKQNKKLYIINKTLDEFNFKIIGLKTSVYYLNYYGVKDNNLGDIKFYGMLNGNYLFNIQTNRSIHLQIYTLPSEISTKENYPIFTGFYPLGCQLEGVYNSFENFTDCYNAYLSPILNPYDFYQYIYKDSEFEFGEFSQDGFYVNKTKSDSKNCLFYSSFFILNDNVLESGISLGENIPRRILFTEKNNEFNFTYAHTDINKDVDITFNLLNEGEYNASIFIKDFKKESYSIKENTTITLTNDIWKDFCLDSKQICRIYLDIFLIINESDKLFEINAKTVEINKER